MGELAFTLEFRLTHLNVFIAIVFPIVHLVPANTCLDNHCCADKLILHDLSALAIDRTEKNKSAGEFFYLFVCVKQNQLTIRLISLGKLVWDILLFIPPN